MAGVNTSGWVYADWITQTTTATRLSQLRLHIQEVSQAAIQAEHGEGRSLKLPPSYLTDLKKEELALAAVDTGRAQAFAPKF